MAHTPDQPDKFNVKSVRNVPPALRPTTTFCDQPNRLADERPAEEPSVDEDPAGMDVDGFVREALPPLDDATERAVLNPHAFAARLEATCEIPEGDVQATQLTPDELRARQRSLGSSLDTRISEDVIGGGPMSDGQAFRLQCEFDRTRQELNVRVSTPAAVTAGTVMLGLTLIAGIALVRSLTMEPAPVLADVNDRGFTPTLPLSAETIAVVPPAQTRQSPPDARVPTGVPQEDVESPRTGQDWDALLRQTEQTMPVVTVTPDPSEPLPPPDLAPKSTPTAAAPVQPAVAPTVQAPAAAMPSEQRMRGLNYFVVRSFKSPSDAEVLAKTLRERGIGCTIENGLTGYTGKSWYSVVTLRGFDVKNNLQAFQGERDRLRSLGYKAQAYKWRD